MNAYQVLREKEMEIARVRQEIEALQVVIPMLADDVEVEKPSAVSVPQIRRTNQPARSNPQAGSSSWP